MYKILVKFTKQDRMKFLSHLELIRVIERAMRRAEVPLKFSQGFNPHPKISFAAPLAVGVSSQGEYLTIEVEKEINLDEFQKNLNHQLPEGMKFVKCKYIDVKSKSLMSLVENATYIVKCNTVANYESSEINNAIEKLMKRDAITYEKRGKRNKIKTVDIKEHIKDLIAISIEDKEIIFKATVSTGSQGNLKPEIVIKKLTELEDVQIDIESIRVHRLETFSSKDNGRLIPIEGVV